VPQSYKTKNLSIRFSRKKLNTFKGGKGKKIEQIMQTIQKGPSFEMSIGKGEGLPHIKQTYPHGARYIMCEK